MTQLPQPSAEEDKAWVIIHTPLHPDELREFCARTEHLYRINPYLEFRQWREVSPDRFQAEFRNHSNNQDLAVDIVLERESENSFRVRYNNGIKRSTRFLIEPATDGSRLTITDDYQGIPETERQQRLPEVDKSLKAWGESLRVYFVRLKRWSWLPGWNWYIRRVWIPMKPSARRIVWWIYLITVAEFFFFLFVLLIYTIEQRP